MKNIFLVDADDTILDFHGVSDQALRNAFQVIGKPWEERFATEFRIVNAGFWAALERKELTRTELMEQRFPAFLRHLGIDADGATFNKAFVTYLAENPRYLPNAESFLSALRERGKVYIVTNGTEWIQRSRFTICKLWEKVDDVFISDAIGHDKPSREYTEYIVKHIPNFETERAVWIGDSLSADIKGAKDANITSIWYNPSQKTAEGEVIPDFIVQDHASILDVLEKI